MTLREAHASTSIPVSTLRKWAKRGKVRARLERVGDRELRFVAYSDVLHRAQTLGRDVEPVPTDAVIDLRAEPVAPPASTVAAPPPPVTRPEPAPVAGDEVEPAAPHDGSILVPLDAWDRLLSQLGNLHEAGQQLADARERAAKAETEAEFLRERLRDMRQELRETQRKLEPVGPNSQSEPTFGGDVSLQARWQEWRRRWLGRRSS